MLPELKIVSGTLRRLTLQPQPLTLGATVSVESFALPPAAGCSSGPVVFVF